MSSNSFDDARVQVRGLRMLAMVESEVLDEDPVEADLLDDLRATLNGRVVMRDALVVARARDDEGDLRDREEMYDQAARGVEQALTALLDYRNGEGA